MADSVKTYSRSDRVQDPKRPHVEPALQPVFSDEDAHYVYDMLKDDFQQNRKEWSKAPPPIKFTLKLPALVDPLKKLTEVGVNWIHEGFCKNSVMMVILAVARAWTTTEGKVPFLSIPM